MKTHLQKWGNSLGVRLPKSFAEELGLCDGSPIELSLDDGAIIIKPDRDRIWDLETLLSGVTGENIHPAWETEAATASAETGEDEDRLGGAERR